MKHKWFEIRHKLATILIVAMSINCFATGVSNNDGSAFITKAEFDALKTSFQTQIDAYNTGIDSKIDEAISSYLSGINIAKEYTRTLICSNLDSVECLYLPSNDNNIFTYKWAPIGLKLTDHSAYLNYPHSAAGWTIMISANLTHTAEEMHKILIKNLDKTNKWALWAGYTETATEDWMGENYWFSAAHKTGLSLTEVPNFEGKIVAQGTNTYFDPVTGRPTRNNRIARTSLQFASASAVWNNDYNFTSVIKNDGDITHKNVIIFKALEEKTFTPQDEVLGWVNSWPRGANVKMKVGEVYDNLNASIYCTLATGSEFKNQNRVYNAPFTNPDDSITYTGSSYAARTGYYPGEKWANSYITNWNQIYTDAYGAIWGPDEDSYLALSAGLPFLKVSKNEVVKYDIAFADPSEKYEIYAMTCPFTDEGATYISYSDVVKLSVDGENYYDSIWVQGGATVYMDFKEKNPIDSDKTVYLKWTKQGETDGGGELIIHDHTMANVTLKD